MREILPILEQMREIPVPRQMAKMLMIISGIGSKTTKPRPQFVTCACVHVWCYATCEGPLGRQYIPAGIRVYTVFRGYDTTWSI